MIEPSVRPLALRILTAWTLAWVAGIGALCWVAIGLDSRHTESRIDADLEVRATAAYGLTYFDSEGVFHDHIWRQEADFWTEGFDFWVLTPGPEPTIHLGPPNPRFELPELDQIAAQAMSTEDGIYRSGQALTLPVSIPTDPDGPGSDAGNQPRPTTYRAYAIPTYLDPGPSNPVAAVVVVGDVERARAAHGRLARTLLASTAVLGLLGLAVGTLLAHWSLRPLALAFARREQFLNAAAHELRTPLATLGGICESALAGDESAEAALRRLPPLVDRAGRVAEELLLFARLEAGTLSLERQALRLDLLVEAELPEDADFEVEMEVCVLEADPTLIAVAVHNLVDNARLHGHGVRLMKVDGHGITVEDRGPGFPAEVLRAIFEGEPMVPSQNGAGIGLAIVHGIAEMHGGELLLRNRDGGGSQAQLRLG